MARPDFLIIGAMKAGTTTLFRDLVDHPGIFLPQEKEPETLVKFGNDFARIQKDYDSLFAPATAGQLLGEASTAYTKRPDFDGVAERARQICGPDLKVIYLTRSPISRIVSQYKHEYGLGLISELIDQAVLTHDRFVAYSRYEWQLEPWRNEFTFDNILELRFEDYVGDRVATVSRVCAFLGVDSERIPDLRLGRAFNSSEGKRVPTGFWKALIASTFYQRYVKPIIPWSLRDKIAGRVLMPAKTASGGLSEAAKEELLRRLSSEVETED